MLSPYRILDLSDERGMFAGALLAQLGAEVVLVEPPEGSPSRARPPFIDDQPSLEGSLWHLGFNRGKESIVVDWRTTAGLEELHQLAAEADAVVLSGGPADHDRRGLPQPAELLKDHPHLIIANISGFGLTGPKADWADGDLVCGAAGFQQSVTGDPDRPPLRTSVPQVFLHASADAAVGILVALAERERSGQGQIVDLSAQESWIWAGFYLAYSAPWDAPVSQRHGAAPKTGALRTRFDFPALDGYVTITLMLGAAVGPFTNRLVEWMAENGMCPSDVADTDWATFDPFGEPDRLDRLNEAVGVFTATKTRSDLMAGARERRLLLAPVLTVDDVLAADQYSFRNVWRSLDLEDGRSVSTPGPLALTSPDPIPDPKPAPKLGQHDALSPRAPFRSRPSGQDAPPETASGPLTGLRVLDLTTSYAGPLVGRTLAAFGATVVKVESQQRPDLARTAPPFLGDGFECSAPYANTNPAKLSIALDLSREGSRPVLNDLAEWCDVLVDAYAPGALSRMGLDPETLNRLNPSLVVLQTTMLGQTGPMSDVPGYGNMATALTGFFATTGWPDRGPVGPVGAYTDMISPRLALTVVLAALDQRRRTGKGMNIDLGQGEACLQLLTLGFLDRQVNGRSCEARGNSDHFTAPHAVYPSAGNDRWVAIACTDDTQWQRLADEIGRQDLRGLGNAERLSRGSEIDEAISQWTLSIEAEEAQARLQKVGVAAHQVQNSPECAVDPQLAARGGWMVPASHEVMGTVLVGASPIRLSRTPAQLATAGPTLGQHTFEVLTDLLGYDSDRIAGLAAAEVLE